MVHLAVLVGRPLAVQPVELDDEAGQDFPDEDDIERWWATATPVQRAPEDDRARKLIEAGVGRRRLSRELGVSEYEARQLLERTRQQSAGRPEVSDLDQYESDGEPR